jgi:hypothetical protein
MSLSNNFPTVSPTLNLNFAAAGRLDSRVTFTRSSTATYTNQIGLIQSAAVNEPRFDYDPSTLAARGLLIEEQRTNLAPYSEQIDLWDRVSATTAANTATAPDGQVTADTISFSGTTATWDIVYRGDFGTGTYTFSIWLKTADNSTKTVYVTWGPPNLANSSALTVTGTWQRFSVTFTVPSASLWNVHLGNVNTLTPAGWSAFNIYAWGGQVEAGSFATSYIPTLASSVTRSADVASVNTLSPWFNSVEMTVYTEYDIIGKTSTFGMASQIDDGTLDNRILNIGQESTGSDVQLGSFMTSGGSPSVNQYPINSMTVGAVYKLAFAVKSNDAATVANTVTLTDGTAVVPTGLTTLRLGRRITDGYLNGHLRRVTYYSVRLTNAQLVALTL